MQILVLNGRPRSRGNTKAMIDSFRSGARSAGHEVREVEICRLKIAGCIACEACHEKLRAFAP